MNNAKHVLGISGGKDSAALAIYLFKKYPKLNIDYYFCDTGKELDETYLLIEKLKGFLGKDILLLKAKEAEQSEHDAPFDVFLKMYRGYLPSAQTRWCTRKLKLDPFEDFVGTAPTISYVGIRGDENREGYISKKNNIQSIFPFRKNIWSEDVTQKILKPANFKFISESYSDFLKGRKLDKALNILLEPETASYTSAIRLNELLNLGTVEFNKVVFSFLKTTKYPLASEDYFPLIENDEVLNREHIFALLRDNGVGVPAYYEKKDYESEGKKGEYARSRSGCYFCFYQQKIEWVWLYEQHPDLYAQAITYENPEKGFTWNQNESLTDLIAPQRIEQIKKEHLTRKGREKSSSSSFLIDILDDTESTGCATCFI